MKHSTEKISSKKNFIRQQIFVNIFIIICLSLIAANAVFSQTVEPKLAELRRQYAANYLKTEAHFALARYYVEHGNAVQAFYIMEYARRNRFEEAEFNAAFIKFFGDSGEPNAAARAAFEKGGNFLKQNNLAEAEKSFVEAATLAPNSAEFQAWVGRFFYKKPKPDTMRALNYYYKAYFLFPDVYETEFGESRIREITIADAEARFAVLLKNGKSLLEIATDSNPLIVGLAIEQMAKQWKKEYTESLLKSMENDDDEIRWLAFETLFKNAGASADTLIKTLSNDMDLRKRGLAAYAMIEFQKEKGFDALRKMLSDNAELIRYDAVSALIMQGGAKGLEIVREHRKTETSAALKKLIDQALQSK